MSGAGRTAWIIDTGIDLDHPDLNTSQNCHAYFTGQSPDDQNGHGTHVAGTIAAIDTTFGVIGVAAGAQVCAVRVLGPSGSGSWSSAPTLDLPRTFGHFSGTLDCDSTAWFVCTWPGLGEGRMEQHPAIDFDAAGGIDLDRLERSLELRGEQVGDGRYHVLGGDSDHWVDLYSTSHPRCDCGDHLWRERICKHILAALLREGNDRVVGALGQLFARVRERQTLVPPHRRAA